MTEKGISYTESELQGAWDIINAEREKQHALDKAKAEAYIGRYFKTRNSYGSDSGWWLYREPMQANEYGHLSGLSFEQKVGSEGSHYELSIVPNDLMMVSMLENNTEITKEEFTEALNDFKRLVADILP